MSLASTFSGFKKLGFFQPQGSVVGIDVGSSSIKVVQLKQKDGKAILETYGELALGPFAKLGIGQATNLSVGELEAALRDLFREANVTATLAAFSIPLRSSLLKVIELPVFDKKQLEEMIPLEARKYIPVPISEVLLDWWVIPKHEFHTPGVETAIAPTSATSHTMAEVLLVAIHNGTIQKYQDLATRMKLASKTFEVETFSAMRALLGHDISPTAILDIGAGTSKLTIVDEGVVRISHTINKGSQDITLALERALGIPFDQAEKMKRSQGLNAASDDHAVASSVLEFIFYEVQGEIASFQKKYGRAVSKIELIGGGSTLRGLQEIAASTLKTEIVKGKPFQKVEAPAFLAEILDEVGPGFAIAVGLALRELEEAGG